MCSAALVTDAAEGGITVVTSESPGLMITFHDFIILVIIIY